MKFAITKFIVVLILLVSTLCDPNYCGMQLSMNQLGFKQIIDKQINDLIEKTILKSFENYSTTKALVIKLDINRIKMVIKPAENHYGNKPEFITVKFEQGKVDLTVQNVNLYFYFECAVSFVFMTPGDCFENYVLFKNFKFNTVFSFKKDENTQKLACEVDKSNVDYEFKYATKNAGILDLVSYHAQGYIGDVLKYSFEDKTELSTYLSGYLEEMNPYTDELISDLKVDYSLLEEPKIEEDKIHFYITGLLFQKDERSKIEEVLKNYKEGKCNKFKQIELGRKEIGIKISQDTFNNNLNLLVKSKQIVKEYDDNENAEEWKKIFTSEYHYRIEMNHFQNLNFGKEGFSLSNVELKSDVRVRLPLNKKFEFEFTQKVNFNNLKISADNSIMTADIEEGNLDVQITRKTINDNDILEKIKNKTLNPIFEIISKKATKIIQQKF